MVRKTREEKAITLIALIITIVVLLILAVVAINAVTGDGIIQHATNAKTEYEKAQTDEEMMLSNYETYLKGNVDTWDGKSKKEPKIKDGDWYIYTCSELKFFADFVNGDEEKEGLEITENTTVYLMSNLDLGARQKDGVLSGTEWIPIGKDADNSFIGIFEGNNHYIKGVYIDNDEGIAGIFGRSLNTIQNLTIIDGYIMSKGSFVGGIVGTGTTILNCHNINSIIKNTGECNSIGGIGGRGIKVENCTNSGVIVAEGMIDNVARAGGIVGFTPTKGGDIKNCKNFSDIDSTVSAIGGIVGLSFPKLTLENCVNIGNITGGENVGGLIGVVSGGSDIENPYMNVINSYNTGDITGANLIGGIIGNLSLRTNRTVKACYNSGKVEGQMVDYTGTIIGWVNEPSENYENIQNLYYIDIEGSTVKGIGNIEDKVNNIDIALKMSGDNMKKLEFANTLNGVPSTDVWVGSDGQYPRLKWEK